MVAAIRPGDEALELEGAIARSQENISFFSLASFSLLGSPGTIHGHRFSQRWHNLSRRIRQP